MLRKAYFHFSYVTQYKYFKYILLSSKMFYFF